MPNKKHLGTCTCQGYFMVKNEKSENTWKC